jgi:hemerythrin superfamily protein
MKEVYRARDTKRKREVAESPWNISCISFILERMMDAIELIKQDHRQVDELFTQFLSAESDNTLEDLFQQIETSLNAHTEMEERAFYPAVRKFAAEKVDEALREHSQVKELLADLHAEDIDEEGFESQFHRLVEDVRHHVEEEESPDGILELARQHMNHQELARLGAELQRIKEEVEEDLAA